MATPIDTARHALVLQQGWFARPGVYVLVDGQYGSTGKGLLAHYMALLGQELIDVVSTNAGPNSGHTTYFEDERVMTQQIPVAGVILQKLRKTVQVHLNAGAIVDPDILDQERELLEFEELFSVHPCAAVIKDEHKNNTDALASIASTNKGVGQALASKVLREDNVWGAGLKLDRPFFNPARQVIFLETAQGFSLGINQRFHPYSTSRECTVSQAMSDAGFPPNFHQKTVMTLRTYPIRVGNTDKGHSGGCYPDQKETTWEAIGQAPELTTVTKRVRRVFTWSRLQFREALRANCPDTLFLNFCNYLSPDQLEERLEYIQADYREVMGAALPGILLGFGPKVEDIEWRSL